MSTCDQDPELQDRAPKQAGVDRLFTECAGGGRWDHPELHHLLDQIRPGNAIVVWKLDRISRSLKDLIRIIEKIEQSGGRFRSLTENIETTSPAGRMLVHLLGAFAQYEREILAERTQAGLDAARAAGRVGGRRPKLSPEQQAEVICLVAEGRSQADVARLFGVHRSTVGRLVARGVEL